MFNFRKPAYVYWRLVAASLSTLVQASSAVFARLRYTLVGLAGGEVFRTMSDMIQKWKGVQLLGILGNAIRQTWPKEESAHLR